MKLSDLKNKKIAIWGFGIEGQAVAEYLKRHDIVFDVLDTEGVSTLLGAKRVLTPLAFAPYDIIIKSPGITPYSDLVQNSNVQFTSSTAIWFANEHKTTVIAITGTKGKSTTASLLAHIIKASGASVKLLGNIGKALISSDSDCDYIVLEASSYQLYDGNIASEIALVTNLYPEHLDWHNGEENYYKDKLKIFNYANVKIVNVQNTHLKSLLEEGEYIYFNSTDGFHINNDSLLYQNHEVLHLSQINLIGEHNLQNIAAALTVCSQLKIPIEACIEAIKTFQPLPHRLQKLGKIGKHYAINDSISTTPVATLAAMRTQDLSRTTVLIGGHDRGIDWLDFAQSLSTCRPNLLFISGENAAEIFRYLKEVNAQFRYYLTDGLKQAIIQAQSLTPQNHTLLLSPGAPSFDQFENFIKRGEFFEEELRKNAE